MPASERNQHLPMTDQIKDIGTSYAWLQCRLLSQARSCRSPNSRMPFSVTISDAPTSANTAIHSVAIPATASPDLDEFVACYHAENRHERTPTW